MFNYLSLVYLEKFHRSIEKGGWGYDPIFIPAGESKTYANIPNKDETIS